MIIWSVTCARQLRRVCPSVALYFTTLTPLNGFALRIFNNASFCSDRAEISDIYLNTFMCICEHLEHISCIIHQTFIEDSNVSELYTRIKHILHAIRRSVSCRAVFLKQFMHHNRYPRSTFPDFL
jgi:hypothetical protein